MSNKATDKRPQFFLIEDAVVENFDLDPYTGWLYVVIVKHADRQTGEAFPGIARLCKLANMSRSQVIRAIKSLEDKKLLRVERDTIPQEGERRQRGVNHYFVLSASGSSVYSTLGVVSDRNYPSISETRGVVSGADRNQNHGEPESIEPESINKKTPADAPASGQVKPSEVDDLNKIIPTYIKAWYENSGILSKNPYGIKTYREYAVLLYENDILPEDVVAFLEEKREEPFWQGKGIGFKYVTENIRAWKESQEPEQRYPDATFDEPPVDVVPMPESARLAFEEMRRALIRPLVVTP